jgi:hypothetical protein
MFGVKAAFAHHAPVRARVGKPDEHHQHKHHDEGRDHRHNTDRRAHDEGDKHLSEPPQTTEFVTQAVDSVLGDTGESLCAEWLVIYAPCQVAHDLIALGQGMAGGHPKIGHPREREVATGLILSALQERTGVDRG